MQQTNKPLLSIAIVEKDTLIRKSLMCLLGNADGYNVILEAETPSDLYKKLDSSKTLPLICIMDVKPDSADVITRIKRTWPKVKVLVLTSLDSEYAITSMIKSGANGYLLKSSKQQDLQKALTDIHTKGYYYSKIAPKKLYQAVQEGEIEVEKVNTRQREFLTHCCTGANYAEIAQKMKWSVRTIDGYRDALFDKFKMKNRTDLVLFALRAGIVELV